jgi:hypothetical protein
LEVRPGGRVEKPSASWLGASGAACSAETRLVRDCVGYNEAETSFIPCRVIKQVLGRAAGHASGLCRQNVRPHRNRALLALRAAARPIEAKRRASSATVKCCPSPASPCPKLHYDANDGGSGGTILGNFNWPALAAESPDSEAPTKKGNSESETLCRRTRLAAEPGATSSGPRAAGQRDSRWGVPLRRNGEFPRLECHFGALGSGWAPERLPAEAQTDVSAARGPSRTGSAQKDGGRGQHGALLEAHEGEGFCTYEDALYEYRYPARCAMPPSR